MSRRHDIGAQCSAMGGSLRSLWRAAFAAATLLLAACSSGDGGEDVTIGSGQTADPVTLEFPVFYIKRPAPTDTLVQDDARRLLRFEAGADLYMRDRASPSAPEINLTGAVTQGAGDVRDLDINFDGTRVVFSMRVIDDPDADPLPTWNVWEYDTTSATLRRVIPSDTVAEEGHDIMPAYLPDGRIVFSSTRQRQSRAILLDENKPQFAAQDEDDREPAFVLHVMDADGANINQISFNQSHDLDPSVLADGRIVFTRWEHHIDDNQFDLYRSNPDGTGLELLYGAHSHATGSPDPQTGTPTTIQFLSPRVMPDGRTMALIRPFSGTGEGGDLVLIDTDTYVNDTQATAPNAGLNGSAQTRALPTDVRTARGPSPGGRYRSAAPLFDGTGRLMVSWSQCRLLESGRIVPCTAERLERFAENDATLTEAPPLYGIYVYDVRENTQQPVVAPQEGFIFTDVVAGSSRTLPPVVLDLMPDGNLLAEGVGILHIRSVYDVDGVDSAPGGLAAVSNPGHPNYADRPARFLRIEKTVSMPDDDTLDELNLDLPGTAFGPNGRGFGMREILGYAPIEPDGSVKVKIPANVAFALSVLDRDGRRLPGVLGNRHTNWLQVRPGELLECTGCHNPSANPPRSHGRRDAFASVHPGAPASGVFPGTNTAMQDSMGRSMAETRWTVMCERAGEHRGGNCGLSVNLMFDDLWSPTPTEPPISACYLGGGTNYGANPIDLSVKHQCPPADALPAGALLPTTAACAMNWNSLCRIVIHYEQHIHPLWGLERWVFDAAGAPVLDGNGLQVNNRCTTCHAPVDALAAPAVPAGELDLTDGASDEQPDRLRSYRELLFADRGQILVNGELIDECIQTSIDPETLIETCVAYRQVPAPMSANGARASQRFFTKMENAPAAGAVDHRGFMSRGELKLIAEWLDIGAQYYNDPFAIPAN